MTQNLVKMTIQWSKSDDYSPLAMAHCSRIVSSLFALDAVPFQVITPSELTYITVLRNAIEEKEVQLGSENLSLENSWVTSIEEE